MAIRVTLTLHLSKLDLTALSALSYVIFEYPAPAPWDKGQCPHGALLHAGTARLVTLGSYPTLLEALATP